MDRHGLACSGSSVVANNFGERARRQPSEIASFVVGADAEQKVALLLEGSFVLRFVL